MFLGFWLLAGVALGMILMAFLAIGTYERGYSEGYFLRRPWRAELGARRRALTDPYVRKPAVAAPPRTVFPSPVAAPDRAAASGG
jgi:hypothetical protein